MYVVLSVLVLVFSVSSSLEQERSAKVYKVSYRGNEEISRQEDTDVQCYLFTWVGPTNDRVNKSTGCADNTGSSSWGHIGHSDEEAEARPCFEPVVYTDGEHRNNGPNLTELERACREGGSVGGRTCKPMCPKNENSCVKLTYYRRDKERTVVEYSSFCGQGFQTSRSDGSGGGETLREGCHYQESHTDFLDAEVCFCNTDRCNGAAHAARGNNLGLVAFFVATVSFVRAMPRLDV